MSQLQVRAPIYSCPFHAILCQGQRCQRSLTLASPQVLITRRQLRTGCLQQAVQLSKLYMSAAAGISSWIFWPLRSW